ncbi:hypothetical protein RHDC3_02363 [Rhodocyclaceae bacterium]|nr:hypothetical protein RHDC3_02363 [Rhodocyclaceae bacterium]
MKNRSPIVFATAMAVAGLFGGASAQTTTDEARALAHGKATPSHIVGSVGTSTAVHKPAAMSEGEVRAVDHIAKKITLKHREIENLGMPRMTMVFHVKDPTMLDSFKQGDKVMFRADRARGVIVVTAIRSAN